MEGVKLAESLDLLGSVGVCVGTEQCQLLQNSLLVLQKENHFQKCYYWGRINGVKFDYHIAYGFEKDCLKKQVYYYSTNCINWLLLPKPTKTGLLLTPLAINKFQGDPSVVTHVYNVNPLFPPDADTENEDAMPRELKEEDRLSTTIEFIKKDATVIPRGAWMKTPSDDIIENRHFCGLTPQESRELKSYLHARYPQQKWNANLLTRSDYNYALDFLDPIDIDIPSGCWNLQSFWGGHLMILNSLLWPGMTLFYKVDTPHHGFLYVGNGKKNMDLPFMISFL